MGGASLSEIFRAHERPDEIDEQQRGHAAAGNEIKHSDALAEFGVGGHDQD
jgi:hypothetical protein